MFAYLTAAGIRCRIVQLEYGAWINLGRRDARPEMDGIASWMWGHGALGDPTDAWGGHLHSYRDGWGWYSYHDDPELDEMVETLRVTADPEAKGSADPGDRPAQARAGGRRRADLPAARDPSLA